MQRTKAAQIYKKTGNLRAVQLRSHATLAEPFERSRIDEPFATSMTRVRTDRFQTFSVLPCVEKHRVFWEYRLHKNLNLSAGR
jgi:hypothetical protein